MTTVTPLPPALPLLRPEEEPVLGFWVEAGILAADALTDVLDPARRGELENVRAVGEQAIERMIRSNVRLAVA